TDLDAVHVLEATNVPFDRPTDQIPAIVRSELLREVTVRLGYVHRAAAFRKIVCRLQADLISAHNEDVITGLDPVFEKVIDHQHVDLRGIGDAVEHVLRHLRHTAGGDEDDIR